MDKLGLVIVTYQRADILDELLSFALKEWIERSVRVYIMDGSEDDQTSEMMKRYETSSVVYCHLPGTPVGVRVIEGCKIANTEYICISGDSVFPIFLNYSKLFNAFEKHYDIIDFTYRDPKKIGDKEYDDIVEMYKDNAWDMTQLGNVFFRKSSYRDLVYEDYCSRYKDTVFLQMSVYFDCFIGNTFKGYHADAPVIETYKKSNKKHWGDRVIQIGCYGWHDIVSNAPSIYDNVKDEVLMSHGKYSNLRFDRAISFIKYRARGDFDYRIYRKYERYIKKTVPLNSKILILISKMPRGPLYMVYRLALEIRNVIRGYWL